MELTIITKVTYVYKKDNESNYINVINVFFYHSGHQ